MRLHVIVFAAAVAALPTSASAQEPACEGEACAGDGARPHWPLIASGAAILGVSWISNIVASAFAGQCGPEIRVTPGGTGCTADAEWDAFRGVGAVPLIGPWIQLALKPTPFDADGWAAWLILDGAAQLVGLAVLVVGLTTPRRTSDDGLSIAPLIGPRALGLVAAGRL